MTYSSEVWRPPRMAWGKTYHHIIFKSENSFTITFKTFFISWAHFMDQKWFLKWALIGELLSLLNWKSGDVTRVFWDAPSGLVDLCFLSVCLSCHYCHIYVFYSCTFTSHFSVTVHVCRLSLSFYCFLYILTPVLHCMSSLFSLQLFFLLLLFLPLFPVLCPSAAVWRSNPGGVSSGQSYPSAQYESGLQQRGQQGEQPGHQPRTLLHTPRWVAVADRHPGGMCSKILMSKTSKKKKVFLYWEFSFPHGVFATFCQINSKQRNRLLF